jgi:MinD-like ATPase involved in chromosome partitioning or flagellar assembly
MMPGLNGYDVVNRLRADNRTKSIPIIILTARGQPVDRHAAIEVGANKHLAKPVDIQELLATIDNLLEMGAFASLREKLILPVISLRGGAGVTTIAVNLALLMQQIAPTLLWDLSPSSGHAALSLGLEPTANWAQYLQSPMEDISSLLLKHPTGLKLMAAPPIPDISHWFNRKYAMDLQNKLLQYCSIMLIDMPSFLDESTAALLQQGHHIILISGDDNPGIQTTLATLQCITSLFASKSELQKVVLVHNTVTGHRTKSVDILQNTLGHQIAEVIPFEEAQHIALRKGIPLAATNPTSPLVVRLKRLTQTLLK